MIHATFTGRLVADPVADEKKTTIRVAVDGRKVKDEKHTDFLSCVCFGKTAEFASTIQKGKLVLVSGTLQTREYESKKEGRIKTSLDVSVSSLELLEWDKKDNTEPTPQKSDVKLPWE